VGVGWRFEAYGDSWAGTRSFLLLHASQDVEVLEQGRLGVGWRGFMGDVGAGEVDFYAQEVAAGESALGGGDEVVGLGDFGGGACYGDYEGFCLLRLGCGRGDLGDY